jgi:alpha-L-fucosidase
VVDATPFRRDVVRELADACHRHGLRFGLYYSQSQDWHHPGGGIAQDRSWDPAQAGDHDLYLRTIAEPQVRELLGRYGPISLIWFDTPLHMTEARTRPFAQAVRTLQPDCLINSRLMLRSADVRGKILSADQLALVAAAGCDYLSRGDNEIPNQVVPGLWETPATINDTWGYKQDDHHWKPPADLVFKLVDIVSKGGNYLLNVGPDATGRIPQPSQQALRAVGRWLRVNGEAIYGAGPSPFGHEFGGSVPADIAAIPPATPPAKTTFVVPRQWRCTTKPGRLYLHVFEWPPAGKLHLDGATATPTRAYLLADARRRPLPVALDGGRLTIDLPADPPGELARVVCLEMESSTP